MSLSKAAALEEAFKEIRSRKRIPVINKELSYDGHVQVDVVCIHGRSDESLYVDFMGDKEEDLDLDPVPEDRGWENESSGFGGGEYCEICEQGIQVVCPKDGTPFPVPKDEDVIKAYEQDEDLLCTTRCPTCDYSWLVWGGGGNPPAAPPRKMGPESCGMWGLATTSKTLKAPNAPGRNDPCLCGSGKKYKKCCLEKKA